MLFHYSLKRDFKTQRFLRMFLFEAASSPQSVQSPPSPVPSPSHSSKPVEFFGLLPPLPPSSLLTQSTPPRECPVIPKKLPKRLDVAYFWARTRIVQKACMVRLCCSCALRSESHLLQDSFRLDSHQEGFHYRLKDGAYYCYCAYVLRISRYSGFLWVVLTYTGIFLRGLKLSRENRT